MLLGLIQEQALQAVLPVQQALINPARDRLVVRYAPPVKPMPVPGVLHRVRVRTVQPDLILLQVLRVVRPVQQALINLLQDNRAVPIVRPVRPMRVQDKHQTLAWPVQQGIIQQQVPLCVVLVRPAPM